MIIKFDKEQMELIDPVPFFDNKYYKMPILYEGFDVVYEIYDDNNDDTMYIFGRSEEGMFQDDGDHLSYPCYDKVMAKKFVVFDTRREGELPS